MKTYLDFFYEISKIPRMSGREEKIAEYLVKFAKDRGLKYYRDSINNVIIWKDASLGYEDKKILGLQSHTDMICEKTPDKQHDFLVDSLDVQTDGDFIKADRTTLGADNGIGVAYMLQILDSKELEAPKLECIFTVQEETTMDGARLIDENKLLSNQVISFDNFSENEMWISSANSKEWLLNCDIKYENLSENYNTYELNLSGFPGGHSGLDIGDIVRVNPIKLGVEVIRGRDIFINEINGGSKVNIIPRECKIIFSTKEEVSNIELKVEELNNKLEKGNIKFQKIEFQKRAFSKELSNNIVEFIYNYKNGAINRDLYNNVILSSNLGVIKTSNKEVEIICSVRTNEKILGEKLKEEVDNNIIDNNIIVKKYEEIVGYFPKDDSHLREKCRRIYKEMFGREIKEIKVQACLECGYFDEKIKDFEYVAIGANIYNAHSPDEKFSISSANRMWEYIVNILKD